jgi:hypothetical protein
MIHCFRFVIDDIKNELVVFYYNRNINRYDLNNYSLISTLATIDYISDKYFFENYHNGKYFSNYEDELFLIKF